MNKQLIGREGGRLRMKNNFFAILLNRNFVKIWMAQIFSLVSAYTLNFVLIGRIFSATHSTVAVSLFLFLYFLPTLAIGPFVGVLVDNLDKRKIFIFSNLLQAIIVLLYLFTQTKVWLVYGIVFLYSFCDEFFNPAVGAVLPAVVKKKELPMANSLFVLTSQGSIIVGSLIGGLILKFFKRIDLVFILASLLLFIAAVASLTLPKAFLKRTKRLKLDFSSLSKLGDSLDFSAFWEQTKDGYRFVKNEALVLFPILLLTGLQAFIGMVLIILPPMAKMLKISFADSSFLLIFPAILGAILGSVLIAKNASKIRKNILVLSGLYLIGVGIILLAILTLFISRPVFIAIPLILILGISYVLIFVPLQTLIQESTPFKIRGRVFGVLNTAINVGSIFPLLIAATLIDFFGLRKVIFGLGTIFLFLAILAQRKKAMFLVSK